MNAVKVRLRGVRFHKSQTRSNRRGFDGRFSFEMMGLPGPSKGT